MLVFGWNIDLSNDSAQRTLSDLIDSPILMFYCLLFGLFFSLSLSFCRCLHALLNWMENKTEMIDSRITWHYFCFFGRNMNAIGISKRYQLPADVSIIQRFFFWACDTRYFTFNRTWICCKCFFFSERYIASSHIIVNNTFLRMKYYLKNCHRFLSTKIHLLLWIIPNWNTSNIFLFFQFDGM